ncbi:MULTISPECIES: Uma2 family endonuclease [Cyanophyceae]|uniref:Uma2 family endonuclease n=1 Tax=Cyanophyceae TaxID=3028117 RepID=UPI00232ADFCB|nr:MULTISPECIES: Uma2 family endonuclease [Cyanophyceae]MDB9304187.1 Uma2 family endonuclease [Nodularia spumigena CS-591/12]MDB9319282.1 Uma2 family endonuclease [Nodularia spumigena CS-590/01A]MDB9325724.1 Uma2 family endonuclease [Nodularia spumigena CS-590/02]MDB9335647.1 Uma2 family endonuclease [Nodularia spumigena CS-590/01]MDB9340479.1 Uma2 family endonuclease [Nodularia spumigena CS-589/07]
MVLQTENRYYTPAEYLALEEQAEYKNEYRNGAIIPMTGGTTNHNKIALNFCRKFPLTIAEQDYEIYIGDVKLWIPQYRIYTYPDIMVVKGQPIYQGTGTTTITNPLLIVEVLSNSTKNYDKTDKFKYYRSLAGFQEYIMIDQYSFAVEQFVKQTAGQWLFKEYEGENAVLVMDALDFQIALSEIYHRVNVELNEE